MTISPPTQRQMLAGSPLAEPTTKPANVRLDTPWYSHVNEDSTPERLALSTSSASELVCVAGSGERLIALLDAPAIRALHVVDIDEDALALTRAKLDLLRTLSPPEYLLACGHEPATADERERLVRAAVSVDPELSYLLQSEGLRLVRQGLVDCGRLEQFLARSRPLARLTLGPQWRALLAGAHPDGAISTLRANLLFRTFGLRGVHALLGNRDPAFVGRGSQLSVIPRAFLTTINRGEGDRNAMLHVALAGHVRTMPHAARPWSTRRDTLHLAHDNLRSGRITVHYHHADLIDMVASLPAPGHGARLISASDLLSFVPADRIASLVDGVTNSATPTTLVLRAFARGRDELYKLASTCDNTVEDLSQLEQSHAYSVFAFRSGACHAEG